MREAQIGEPVSFSILFTLNSSDEKMGFLLRPLLKRKSHEARLARKWEAMMTALFASVIVNWDKPLETEGGIIKVGNVIMHTNLNAKQPGVLRMYLDLAYMMELADKNISLWPLNWTILRPVCRLPFSLWNETFIMIAMDSLDFSESRTGISSTF